MCLGAWITHLLFMCRIAPSVKSWPEMRPSCDCESDFAVCSAGTKITNLSEKADTVTGSTAECEAGNRRMKTGCKRKAEGNAQVCITERECNLACGWRTGSS